MKKSTGVVLVLIIVLLLCVIGAGAFFFVKGNNDSTKEIAELKNEVAGLVKNVENTVSESTKTIENNTTTNTSISTNQQSTDTQENKRTSTTKTYSDLQGTYESQKINMNQGTNLEPAYLTYTIIFSKEGTFSAYYLCGDTSCHYVGYYTIDNNKLSLHSVVLTGNDPSAGLSNEVFEFTINSDGTFSDKDNNKFTRKSETPREDTNIAKVINQYMAGCNTSGKDGQGPWFFGLSN